MPRPGQQASVAALAAAGLVAAVSLAAPPASAAWTPPITPDTSAVTAQFRAGICTGPNNPASAALARQINDQVKAAYKRAHSGTIGFALRDDRTGVSCGHLEHRRTESASIAKVILVSTMLVQHQRSGKALSKREKSLAKRAITESDNDAASAIWRGIGGARGAKAFLGLAGMKETTAGPGRYWGNTMVTAADQVTLMGVLTKDGVLTAASRSYVLTLMRHVVKGQRWGISAGAPKGSVIAVKDGWGPRGSRGWRINSIGLVTHAPDQYSMALISDGHRSRSAGVAAISSIAAAANAAFRR